eukprot:6063851-Amphidinium_carterae.1
MKQMLLAAVRGTCRMLAARISAACIGKGDDSCRNAVTNGKVHVGGGAVRAGTRLVYWVCLAPPHHA